jgi:hypothetical protein
MEQSFAYELLNFRTKLETTLQRNERPTPEEVALLDALTQPGADVPI